MKIQDYRGLLEFKSHVYEPPYSPWYDNYKGHVFCVHHPHPEDPDGHVFLACIDDTSVKLLGAVHWDDLKRVLKN
jgi:hypothetical protein